MARFQRRKLLAAAVLAWPWFSLARAPKVHRLGYLGPADEASEKRTLEPFLLGMRELGYVIGRNLVVDIRAARGEVDRYPTLSDELIALGPDLLLGTAMLAARWQRRLRAFRSC